MGKLRETEEQVRQRIRDIDGALRIAQDDNNNAEIGKLEKKREAAETELEMLQQNLKLTKKGVLHFTLAPSNDAEDKEAFFHRDESEGNVPTLYLGPPIRLRRFLEPSGRRGQISPPGDYLRTEATGLRIAMSERRAQKIYEELGNFLKKDAS